MYDSANFKLADQVAVITGADAGIGRAIAETFAAAGAAVMVSDLDPAAANAVAKGIEAKGGQAAVTACDVTQEDDLARLIEQTIEHFGKLSILVSNAGGGGPKPFAVRSISTCSRFSGLPSLPSPKWKRREEDRCWPSL